MNKPNNSRRKASRRRIEAAFVRLLQQKPMDEITVSEICKLAEVNRSTFYANYLDIYDLVDNVQLTMEQMVMND
ncbi:MAG: TetR/AcrR family transcriptional regulator, partial [Oscillospiraceae bacterium]|nr:TetR/AcrR family transcriptional regulator [Oscillospiraceae bacterium]